MESNGQIQVRAMIVVLPLVSPHPNALYHLVQDFSFHMVNWVKFVVGVNLFWTCGVRTVGHGEELMV